MRPRLGGLVAACILAPWPAQAALWTAEPSVELSCGANDNYGLSLDGNNRVGTMTLTGALGASRQTEASTTRLDARVTELLLRGDLRKDQLQDKFTLGQTLADERDTVVFTLDTERDDTLQTPTSSANLLIGQGLQRTDTMSAGWTRELTSRLSLASRASLLRTNYSHSLVTAKDYADTALSETLRYLLDERDSVNVQASHADYRALDGSLRSMTDNATVGFSRALTETDKLSLDIGAYRTRTAAAEAVLVCPDDPSLCNGGLVSPVTELQLGRTVQWGFQYDGSWALQVDERTQAALAASRAQDPSGTGVTVRTDTLKASLDRDLTERTHVAASYTRSSSVYEGVALGQQPRLQTLEGFASRQLSPQMTLRAVADFTHADVPISGQHANSASVQLILRYEWQRLEASH